MAAKTVHDPRLAIALATAIGFLVLASPSLADTGSVIYNNAVPNFHFSGRLTLG